MKVDHKQSNITEGDVIKSQKIISTAQPVKLTFENLEFEVNILLNKQDAKSQGIGHMKQKIVKGVSGYALPG